MSLRLRRGTAESPYFASEDIDVAWDAAISKIDLDNPANSRFVLRLRQESHNCWGEAAPADAQEMEDAIARSRRRHCAVTVIDPALVTSMALGLPNGIVAASGGRHERNVIAMYEFKTGAGNQAYDTSGCRAIMNLTLSGDYSWVGGWGVAVHRRQGPGLHHRPAPSSTT